MAVSRPALPLEDNVPFGIVYMLMTTAFFVTLDATAKYLMDSLPVAQVVWSRFIFHLIFVSMLLGPKLFTYVRSNTLKLQLVRSALMVTTNALFFIGLQFASLTTATSIIFLGPIFVTILAIPLLGESVGVRRWTGVACGFIGAMIIIRPGSGVLDFAAIFFLATAFTHACYQIITRKIRTADHPFTTLIYTAVVGAVVTSCIVPFEWVTPTFPQLGLMAVLGACGAVGHYFLIKALQSAPAAAVVPFSYTSLLWATLYGYFLFAELPDLWTVVGAAVIACSGLYIFYREQQLKRQTTVAQTAE
jgi:drug/metabolite transporter (DMT)-like permease